MELVDFLLTPQVWWIALAVWLVSFAFTIHKPEAVIEQAFDKKNARPGQLYSDGNTATSKLERRVRADIEKMGFSLYPPSTALVTDEDERGRIHKYTPDIMVKSRKVIVEVDPEFTHAGIEKEADDRRRGQCYEDLGYGVVRLRLGKGLNSWGKYSLHFDKEDWDPDTMYRPLMRMIQKARPEH